MDAVPVRQLYDVAQEQLDDQVGYSYHHQFGGCFCWRRGAKLDSSESQISGNSNRTLLERAMLYVCLCFEGKGKLMLGYARAAWRRAFNRIRAELRLIWKRKCAKPIKRFQYDAVSYAQNFDDGSWKDHDYHYLMSTFFHLQTPGGEAHHVNVSH